MLVRTYDELMAAGREKVLVGGRVRTMRFLTRDDGMGFTVADVRSGAGMEAVLWYKHHWEANYVVSGTGQVTDLVRERSWPLTPGTLFCVGPSDRHRVAGTTDMRIISVFNPPLAGDEAHDADGAYPPTGEVPPGQPAMFVKTAEGLRAAGAEKVVAGGTTSTIRMLTRADGLGFTVSDVRLGAGRTNVLWYKHHWEANYVLAGEGEVVDLATEESWPLAPGTMYIVGPPDRHSMRAETDLHLISVFNPALEGDEMHDADGALPPSGPLPPGPPGG